MCAARLFIGIALAVTGSLFIYGRYDGSVTHEHCGMCEFVGLIGDTTTSVVALATVALGLRAYGPPLNALCTAAYSSC